MTAIDVEKLLLPVTADDGCGPALDYDPSFQEMERAAQGKPEQQIGTTKVSAEDPEWKRLQELATEVLGRSKDLRAAVFLTRAVLRTEGLPGFSAGLTVVRRMLETSWDDLHPRLDPDDGNDPTLRMNVLDSLTDLDATLRALREIPLVTSRALGRFNLRDLEIASAKIPLPADYPGDAPTPDRIDAAFADANLEDISASAEAVGTALAQVDAIDAFLAARLVAGSQADLEPLRRSLSAMHQPLSDALARRGGIPSDGAAADQASNGAASAGAALGAINSWDDVERAIDRICEFYKVAQPASPVPLLMQRARSMVRMDFMQLLEELAPSAISDAERILLSPKKNE